MPPQPVAVETRATCQPRIGSGPGAKDSTSQIAVCRPTEARLFEIAARRQAPLASIAKRFWNWSVSVVLLSVA